MALCGCPRVVLMGCPRVGLGWVLEGLLGAPSVLPTCAAPCVGNPRPGRVNGKAEGAPAEGCRSAQGAPSGQPEAGPEGPLRPAEGVP